MAESVKDQTSQSVEKGRPSTWCAFTPHQALYRDNLHIPFIVMNVQYLVTKHSATKS